MTEFDWQKGHRQRLRERFKRTGFVGMHDYEKLELLLTYAIPRRDVKPVAKALLLKFESLPGVLDATLEELCQVPWVGENVALFLKCQRELCCAYLEQRMRSVDVRATPEAAADFARMKLGANRHETFMVIYLNPQAHVIDFACIEGAVDRAAVYPRNIVEECLRLKAVSVILIHNHPSGVCLPSNEDIAVTRAVEKTLNAMNIRLIDHLIVSPASLRSMARDGLLSS